MSSSLFFQSDVKDPYSIYKLMLDKNPVYWDETNQIWAIYSYEYCVEILKNAQVEIPIVNPNNEQNLNESALDILNNLTRLSNGIQHEITREIAMLVFSNLKSIVIDQIISQGCTPVIPPRSNRKVQRDVDYYLYKERHLIECFFSKVKQFRRIFSRFDKTAVAYMGFLAFASAIIWLR